ncbi:hypothetical protein DMB90_17345 [Raoultella planticola]|uniref:SecD export protein N-terminal TM domain-containing protein n=1 Tax=Raoultella planticola TaxID=575 RepID=A0A5P6AAM8_RAOPL|nr:hypothetical protein DMB90_17345 [Raoultella planticola]
MLNRYPLWKYIMLVVVIIVGLMYALPNLYGEDPAVQITGARGVAASEQTLIQVQKTLQEEKLPLSLWHWKRAQSLRASTPPMSSCAHVKCWWTC